MEVFSVFCSTKISRFVSNSILWKAVMDVFGPSFLQGKTMEAVMVQMIRIRCVGTADVGPIIDTVLLPRHK